MRPFEIETIPIHLPMGLIPLITVMKERLTPGLPPIIAFTKVDQVTINYPVPRPPGGDIISDMFLWIFLYFGENVNNAWLNHSEQVFIMTSFLYFIPFNPGQAWVQWNIQNNYCQTVTQLRMLKFTYHQKSFLLAVITTDFTELHYRLTWNVHTLHCTVMIDRRFQFYQYGHYENITMEIPR